MSQPSPARTLLRLSVLVLTLSTGCGGSGGGGGAAPQPGLPSTQSGPLALSVNGLFLALVNPDVNTLSVLQPSSLAKLGEVPVGRDPQAVVIHPLQDVAYVANAQDGTVSVVTLPAGPVTATIAVGAEPLALALSPNGTRLYVAESALDRVSAIDTATNAIVGSADLSAFGSQPRALAVTNDGDGDDGDETVFAALFFASLRPGKTFLEEGQDDQREGRVVALAAAGLAALPAPNPIVLSPMAVTGFNSNGRLAPANLLVPAVPSTNPQTFTTATGAYPNQLACVALQPGTARGYVVSTAASPNGPLRFNHMVQGLVSVFSTAARTELTSAQTAAVVRQEAPLNLNRGINFDVANLPRLFLSNPVAMAWRPDGSDAWVAVQNSDVVVRLTTDAGGVPTVGAPLLAGGTNEHVRVDLRDVAAGEIPLTAPRGVVFNAAGNRIWVQGFTSRSVTAIDVSTPTAPAILDTALTTALPAAGSAEARVLQGAELFHTGRGPQERMSSESWGGCIVCHPQGRSDNVTWMFDAGPRQTIPLDGTFARGNPADQRILNWSAVRDENHDFELNTRGVFGGRGLIDDDRLFFAVGGAAGGPPVDAALIEQFQQATGAVGATNDLAGGAALPSLAALTARRDFGLATLPDGRVYVIGGRFGAGQGTLVPALDAVLEFNPRTNTLVRRSSTGFTLRHSLGAVAVRTSAGVRVYAAGGYASTSATQSPTGTMEEYDPATDTWRTVGSVIARAQFGLTVTGGHNAAEPTQVVRIVGGNGGTEAAPALGSNALIQIFTPDPVGPGSLISSNAGLAPRRLHGVATVLRGTSSRVFVIGGLDAAGTVLDTVEEFVAVGSSLVTVSHTPLPAPRARFGVASVASSNQVLVVGGVDGAGADQTTILEYTPATNGPVPGTAGTPTGVWAARGNLSAARSGLQVSTPPGVTNFLPVANAGRDARQDAIAAWVAARVRAARAPADDPAATILQGRTLFGTPGLLAAPGLTTSTCATCHGGPKWTRSTVDYAAPPAPDRLLGLGDERVVGVELRETLAQPSVLFNVGTFLANAPGGRVHEIRFNGADVSQAVAPLGAAGFNIPSLFSLGETAPYFYDGLAQTLAEVLDGTHDGNGGGRRHFVASASDRAALIAFLRSIDDTTIPFP